VEVRTKPPFYASYVQSRDVPLVKMFEWAYREAFGKEPHFEYSSSITDANTFAGEGKIPCIHLGPFSGGAHQRNEYTLIDSLAPVSEAFAYMTAKFLS
jgi:acetylornithine deacetylase/succinyl-diaminopimelate desuccinylase-like protein